MLKKIIAIFFLSVYAAAAMGTIVFTHYCMNREAGTSFWHNDICSKCGMTEQQGKGCCKDQPKLIKLSLDHTAAATAEINFPDYNIAALLPQVFNYTKPIFNSFAANNFAVHSPPDISLKRNILYSVFRI